MPQWNVHPKQTDCSLSNRMAEQLIVCSIDMWNYTNRVTRDLNTTQLFFPILLFFTQCANLKRLCLTASFYPNQIGATDYSLHFIFIIRSHFWRLLVVSSLDRLFGSPRIYASVHAYRTIKILFQYPNTMHADLCANLWGSPWTCQDHFCNQISQMIRLNKYDGHL